MQGNHTGFIYKGLQRLLYKVCFIFLLKCYMGSKIMVYTVCCYIHIVPEPLQELCMYIGFIYIRGLEIYIYIYIYSTFDPSIKDSGF